MYLSIDPIATARSPPRDLEQRLATNPETGIPLAAPLFLQPVQFLTTIPLIRQQNGCAMAPSGYG
jgi:hypothetical protein